MLLCTLMATVRIPTLAALQIVNATALKQELASPP